MVIGSAKPELLPKTDAPFPGASGCANWTGLDYAGSPTDEVTVNPAQGTLQPSAAIWACEWIPSQ